MFLLCGCVWIDGPSLHACLYVSGLNVKRWDQFLPCATVVLGK